MTLETSKAYRRRFSREEIYTGIFRGYGIDIGGGSDPLRSTWFSGVKAVHNFDLPDGDAQDITKYVKEQFDFVYSSNCLEHMADPVKALVGWWELVKPDGHLVLIVHDEDMYEQGFWPSRWNGDHKHTFTVFKDASWSPVSVNLAPLWQILPGARLVHIRMADYGWKPGMRGIDQTFPEDGAEAFIEMVLRK